MSSLVLPGILSFWSISYSYFNNVVGLKLQAHNSRPNGGMGIYWNLHISIEEIYKFVFLHVEYLFFFL